MPRVQLTRQFAEAAACPPGRPKIDFFDADQRGFMLEVRASGGKTFYQRYTDVRGRERQFKIGPAEMLTLDQARRKARLILAQALVGEDPQQQRRELRETPTLKRVRARPLSAAREELQAQLVHRRDGAAAAYPPRARRASRSTR